MSGGGLQVSREKEWGPLAPRPEVGEEKDNVSLEKTHAIFVGEIALERGGMWYIRRFDGTSREIGPIGGIAERFGGRNWPNPMGWAGKCLELLVGRKEKSGWGVSDSFGEGLGRSERLNSEGGGAKKEWSFVEKGEMGDRRNAQGKGCLMSD